MRLDTTIISLVLTEQNYHCLVMLQLKKEKKKLCTESSKDGKNDSAGHQDL